MPRHLFQVTVNLPGSFRNNINNNEVFNPYVFVRNRLYHFLFHRFALLYARLFSEFHRKLIEFFILLTALFSFILLAYVHVVFVHTPIKCLDDYRDVWKKGGILRVEVLSGKGKENYTLQDSYYKEKTIRLQYVDGQARYFYADHPRRAESEEIYPFEDTVGNESIKDQDALSAFNTLSTEDFQESQTLESDLEIAVEEENFQTISKTSILETDLNDAYIMEFSLEYGYLRLRPAKRKELNISVVFVILDPEENTCFGGSFNRFLLNNFLGYDHVLLSSIKNMAEKKNTKGFVRNAVMEIEYIFINNWSNEKSFFTAAFVMTVFTLTISTLLRHSHHQIFIVVGYWMHHILSSLERRSNIFDAVWPRNFIPTSGAPVLTVILALVGMEAVMSDFFHDRSIALHIIVIVWFADLYDAVCCQSPLSKRHWFRFFYLYHFLFYAYNYKFNGVYWPLSLMTSWLFIFHSMVFFFHHYELPRFLHRAAMFNATRNIVNNPMLSQNSHPGNDPPPPSSNENSSNESSPPSNHPESSVDNQSNDNQSSSIDEQQPADNLVNESVVSAAGYKTTTESPVVKRENSKAKCCNDCHSLQIKSDVDSGIDACSMENPSASVSAAEKGSVELSDTNCECHQKESRVVKGLDTFNHDQACKLNDFSEQEIAEKFVVEGIFKDRVMTSDKSKKCNLNIGQKVEKQENDVHSGDEKEVYTRELSVD